MLCIRVHHVSAIVTILRDAMCWWKHRCKVWFRVFQVHTCGAACVKLPKPPSFGSVARSYVISEMLHTCRPESAMFAISFELKAALAWRCAVLALSGLQ
jgi:hypothetical protein